MEITEKEDDHQEENIMPTPVVADDDGRPMKVGETPLSFAESLLWLIEKKERQHRDFDQYP